MKKQIIFVLAALAAVITMASCKKHTAQTAVLNDMNDSINYALGYANGDGIANYYMGSVDDKDKDAAIKAFIEALEKAFNSSEEPDELYQLGTNIGTSLKQQEKNGLMGDEKLKFNYKLVKQGLESGLKGASEDWTADEAQSYLEMTMMQIQNERMQASMQEDPAEDNLFIEEEIIEAE